MRTTGMSSPVIAPPTATRVGVVRSARARFREVLAFGGVGGIAFLVDVGVFNLLRLTVLDGNVVTAKVVSVIVATAVAWLGHRSLTFRSRRGRAAPQEAVLFVLANAGGLVIAASCLVVSHYVLGFTSAVADNVAANVVGLGLGTLFRYFAYRHFVFSSPRGDIQS